MSVINSSDVYRIICKTLNTVNVKVMRHSQIVGYTLFKMLQYENEYPLEDIIDYTMLGILHDIGLFKTEIVGRLADYELNNVWDHSVYGYLFLRYLSPLKDKADRPLRFLQACGLQAPVLRRLKAYRCMPCRIFLRLR